MSDYTFMKTGLADLSTKSPAFEDFITKIMGVITVMLQKAVETAGVFAEHGMYHREINAEDIRRAMKVQAQTFFKSDDLEDRVSSVVQDIQDANNVSDAVVKRIKLRAIRMQTRTRKREKRVRKVQDADDVVVFVEVPDHLEDVPPDFELPYNTCECPTCTEIRALVDGWDAWDPQDEVEKFLKIHIDQM